MKFTTLCNIEKDNKYLMLYRNKKENDLNEGKWICVGGKFEEKAQKPPAGCGGDSFGSGGSGVCGFSLFVLADKTLSFLPGVWLCDGAVCGAHG